MKLNFLKVSSLNVYKMTKYAVLELTGIPAAASLTCFMSGTTVETFALSHNAPCAYDWDSSRAAMHELKELQIVCSASYSVIKLAQGWGGVWRQRSDMIIKTSRGLHDYSNRMAPRTN